MNETMLTDQVSGLGKDAALKPASFFHRIAALAIDLIILNIVLLLLGTSMAPRHDKSIVIGFELDNKGVPVVVLYYLLSDWLIRGTPGKRILGLRVKDNMGNKLSFGGAVLRSLARVITLVTFGLGFMTILFRRDKRALHDIMSSSCVLRKQ
jgi:uncharacterized RDD family membrane protein YckC